MERIHACHVDGREIDIEDDIAYFIAEYMSVAYMLQVADRLERDQARLNPARPERASSSWAAFLSFFFLGKG